MKKLVHLREGGIDYFQSPLLLKQGIKHGFSTRRGGVSRGIYATLNTGLTTGDEISRVKENRQKFLSLWGLSLEKAVAGLSVHGVRVTPVSSADKGRGQELGDGVPDTDGLITNERELALTVHSADCQMILIFDPWRKIIGVAHAGWRGLLLGMGTVIIKKMEEYYGTNPEHVTAVVGPSICVDCFEVGVEVVQYFRFRRQYRTPLVFNSPTRGSYYIDLRGIIREQLQEAGVTEDKLSISTLCTKEHPAWFYSHRRDGSRTGRMMGFISME